MRETFFKNSARFLSGNYRVVLWSLGLVFLAAAVYLSFNPPRIESDILGLLPQKNPSSRISGPPSRISRASTTSSSSLNSTRKTDRWRTISTT